MSPELTLIYMDWQYWISTANFYIHSSRGNEGLEHLANDALERARSFSYDFQAQIEKEKNEPAAK